MQKTYLKFENQAAFEAAVANTNYVATDNKTFQIHIGLSKETGNTLTDSEGSEFPEMVYVLGFHVDCYIDDGLDFPTELTSFIIDTPKNPVHRLR